MAILGNQRHLFDIPDDVAWFNCASRTPFLKSVAAAGIKGMDARLHTWDWNWGETTGHAEAVRGLFAGLIGATADDIAIQPSASYGLATAARNLEIARGQKIVVLQDQFPSNVFIWMEKAAETGAQLVTVPRPDDGDWTAAVLAHLDDDTALATLPPCHWSDGTRVDLEAVGKRCRALGAALVVDATQWIGVAPFDIRRVKPDFLVAAAYKWLLCPHGMSFLYAAPERQNGRPLEHHDYNHPATAASIEGALVYDPTHSDGARRYDVGQTFNPVQLPMARAALQQVTAWTPESLAETLAPITARILETAMELGYSVPPAGRGSAHITALAKETPPPADMVQRLAEQGIHASLRGGRLRLAPYVHVTEDDISRLQDALANAWT